MNIYTAERLSCLTFLWFLPTVRGATSMQSTSVPIAPRVWRIVLRCVFGLWLVTFVVVGAYLLAPHLLTLPAPQATDAGLQRRVAAERRPSDSGRWLVLHVLDQDCVCSLRILDHLLARTRARPASVPAGRAADMIERVVWIASTPDPARIAAIHAAGFDLDAVTPEQLGARYHLEAAPLLVVVDPSDRVHYVGGYTPRKQADDVRDVAIIDVIRRGGHVTPLPTFGCAVGQALRTTIDPLGLRRWN